MRVVAFVWLALLLLLCVRARTEIEDGRTEIGGDRRLYHNARADAFRAARAALGRPSISTIETVIDDVLTKSGLSAKALDAARIPLLRFLFMASGWASIGSLNGLVQQVSKKGSTLSIDAKGASLGDFLLYLNWKGHFREHKSFMRSTHDDVETASGKFTLLLDTMMLRRLNDVPSFLANVVDKKNEFTFVAPFGYEAINIFTTATLPQLAARLHQLLQGNVHDGSQSPKEDFAWMCEVLKALVTDKLPAAKDYKWNVEFVFPPQFDFVDDDEALARFYKLDTDSLLRLLSKNFNPGLPLSRWLHVFAIYSSDVSTQREIAETLRDSGNFFSFEMLGEFSRAIFAQLETHIAESAAMDDLKFIIPLSGKSYGVATMVFFLNHPELSTRTIVKSVGDITEDGPTRLRLRAECARAPACVILDDFAGSGASLMTLTEALLEEIESHESETPPPQVIVGPFVQTLIAKDYISSEGVTSFAGMQLGPAPPHRDWMGSKGYSDGTYFVSLPYMAPDNNNAFMAYIVAPLLLFNGLGSKLTVTPPPKLFSFLGLNHFRQYKGLPLVIPRAVVPTSALCENENSSPTISVAFQCNERVVELEPPTLTKPGLWNWVLTQDFELLFSQLDRLHSRCQLAGPTAVYLGGELEVSLSDVRVYIDPDYIRPGVPADVGMAEFADMMRLFSPAAKTEQSLEPLLPEFDRGDLRLGCSSSFSMFFSRETGTLFVDRGGSDAPPRKKSDFLDVCRAWWPVHKICSYKD